jgi:hypothetical protein
MKISNKKSFQINMAAQIVKHNNKDSIGLMGTLKIILPMTMQLKIIKLFTLNILNPIAKVCKFSKKLSKNFKMKSIYRKIQGNSKK